jgi:hypothetical protein
VWVNRVTLTAGRPLPVYPDQRTSSDRPSMSGWCQQRKFNSPSNAPRRGQNASHEGMTDSLSQIASSARQRRFLWGFFLTFRRGFSFAFSTSA